jgi:hypothetical protein
VSDASLEALFDECIRLADKRRPGYMSSLGAPSANWGDTFGPEQAIPPLIRVIFKRVRGTPRQLAEQRFLDFVPGYRIPCIFEYIKSRLGLAKVLRVQADAPVFPILENYSSDYYFVKHANDVNWQVWLATHDSDSPELVFTSSERFLKFVRECYASGAYSTDADGYLDCDFDKQDLIGCTVDPSVAYWHQ